MRTDKIVKAFILNFFIALVNVVVFSDGLLNIDISLANPLASAFGLTVIAISLLAFFVGNYMILFRKKRVMIKMDSIVTEQDYINALEECYAKNTFHKEISTILEQMRRFKRKKETINDILLQKFDSEELSFKKFSGVIENVEKLFFLNIRSILNKLNAFDQEEYNRLIKNSSKVSASDQFFISKMEIYNEYITFVKEAVEDNEQVLLKLDKALLEISKFNSLEDGELENMPAMQEMDELIKNSKWYK